MSSRNLLALLERAGYSVVRVRGSHHRLEHPTRPPLPEEAHGDVFIAITERGGDGVADPSLGSLAAWFK